MPLSFATSCWLHANASRCSLIRHARASVRAGVSGTVSPAHSYSLRKTRRSASCTSSWRPSARPTGKPGASSLAWCNASPSYKRLRRPQNRRCSVPIGPGTPGPPRSGSGGRRAPVLVEEGVRRLRHGHFCLGAIDVLSRECREASTHPCRGHSHAWRDLALTILLGPVLGSLASRMRSSLCRCLCP
jgi:hypothetical protein